MSVHFLTGNMVDSVCLLSPSVSLTTVPSTIVPCKKGGYPSDHGISRDHRNKTRFMLLYYSHSRLLQEAWGNQHFFIYYNLLSCHRTSSYSYCLNECIYSWTSAKASSPPDESRWMEALLTMLGFVPSSLMPSLTYCCAQLILDRDSCAQLVLDRDYRADDQAATAALAPLGRGALPASAESLCALAITMFVLGTWKR